jgi:gluconokinase
MIIVLMGVAGSGKTTNGEKLAEDLGWKFYDGDDFHPVANVEKMSQGIPLDDLDRLPWLESLRQLILAKLKENDSAILACSALRETYRDYLLVDERVKLIYLKGDFNLIHQRLESREGHFMRTEMLRSQFETLEEPEQGIYVDINAPSHQIIKMIKERVGLTDY